MRIMHISTRLILGGSQENTVLSAEGQAGLGHAVALVYGPIYGPEGSLLQRAQTHGGIETLQIPPLVRRIAPVTDLRCYLSMRRLIRSWKPDVVHTHSSKAGILGRLAAWHEGVRCVVHTIHGLPFHPYQSRLRNRFYILAERIAARRCHRIVAVADAMSTQALAAGIGQPDQFVTVYSGMEVDQFIKPRWSRAEARAEIGVTADDFVLGTISRLAALKGHDDLLDAVSPLMRSRPNLKLLWVGDGWWRKRLLKRVETLGLTGRVIHTGLVPPQEIPKYMQAMDALAHPSYREGLPRAVPQALLSGVPVVVYDVDGAAEVVTDGRVGRLIRPGDLAMLREAVEWMMDHAVQRLAMGRHGREQCRQRFAAERMVQGLEEVYASVLGPGGDADTGDGPGSRPAR